MKKQFTFILLLACLSLACDSGSDSNGARIRLASEFMPLAIGNTWTYEETAYMDGERVFTDTVTYSVTKMVSKSGNTYFEYMPTLDTVWFAGGDWAYLHLDTFFFRYEDQGKVFSWEQEGEQLFYNFNAPFDSARKVGLPYSYVKDTSAVAVLAGRFDDCTIMQGGYNGLVRDVFAKDVGLVSQDLDGPYRRLMSAKVGDRSYP